MQICSSKTASIFSSERPLAILLVAAVCCSWLATLSGCSGSSSPKAEPLATSANEVIEKMRNAYQTSRSYEDHGEIIVRYVLNGAAQEEKHPFAFRHDRGRMSEIITFRALRQFSKGEFGLAVLDSDSANLDSQVLTMPMTDSLKLLEPISDPIGRHFVYGLSDLPLSSKLANPESWLTPPALQLSLGGSQQPWFLGERKLLNVESLDGRDYYRISVSQDVGRIIAWIDTKSYVLRRLELPTTILHESMTSDSSVQLSSLTVDLRDASLSSPEKPLELQASLPSTVKRVTRFVSLPTPFPSELIGKQVATPSFEGSNGESISAANGKLQAFLWFSNDPICQPIVQQFDRAVASARAAGELDSFAVITMTNSQLSAEQLAKLRADWQVREPFVRDSRRIGRDMYDVRMLPTLIVRDAEGVIQFYKIIEDGQLEQELTAVISRLRNGENIAAEMRQEYEDYFKLYRQQLAAAAYGDTKTLLASSENFLARKLPEVIAAKQAWEFKDLKSAGNICVVDSSDTRRIFVLEGFRTVVEFNDAGEVIKRHSIQLPSEQEVTLLRHRNILGKDYFMLGSVLGSQVFLLNDQFQLVRSFPEQSDSKNLIRDFEVFSGDSPNNPWIVLGLWEEGGLWAYSILGKDALHLGKGLSIQSVANITEGELGESILAVDQNQGLHKLTPEMKLVDAKSSAGRSLNIFSKPIGRDAKPMLCSLQLSPDAKILVTGLNSDLSRVWETSLTRGIFQQQVEFVQGVAWPEHDGLWLIARPDGSVHLISNDTTLRDQLNFGESVTGIAASYRGGFIRVFVAGRTHIEAFDIDIEATAKRVSALEDKKSAVR